MMRIILDREKNKSDYDILNEFAEREYNIKREPIREEITQILKCIIAILIRCGFLGAKRYHLCDQKLCAVDKLSNIVARCMKENQEVKEMIFKNDAIKRMIKDITEIGFHNCYFCKYGNVHFCSDKIHFSNKQIPSISTSDIIFKNSFNEFDQIRLVPCRALDDFKGIVSCTISGRNLYNSFRQDANIIAKNFDDLITSDYIDIYNNVNTDNINQHATPKIIQNAKEIYKNSDNPIYVNGDINPHNNRPRITNKKKGAKKNNNTINNNNSNKNNSNNNNNNNKKMDIPKNKKTQSKTTTSNGVRKRGKCTRFRARHKNKFDSNDVVKKCELLFDVIFRDRIAQLGNQNTKRDDITIGFSKPVHIKNNLNTLQSKIIKQCSKEINSGNVPNMFDVIMEYSTTIFKENRSFDSLKCASDVESDQKNRLKSLKKVKKVALKHWEKFIKLNPDKNIKKNDLVVHILALMNYMRKGGLSIKNKVVIPDDEYLRFAFPNIKYISKQSDMFREKDFGRGRKEISKFYIEQT